MKKLKTILPLLIFVIILGILEVDYWTTTDETCGLGFGIICYAILFPISSFIMSLIYSLKTKSNKKYFLVLFFGISIMLFEYTTYKLDNMLNSNNIRFPEITTFLVYGVISLIGILLGNLRKKRN